MDKSKKGLAITILEGRKRPPEEEEGGDSDMYETAAGNILDAVRSDDPASLAASMRDFVEMCKG